MKWTRNRKLFLAVSLVMTALLFLDFVMVFIIQNAVLTFMFSLLSVIAGFAFYNSLPSKNRKLFAVISMATLASLISLLVIVPLAFGDGFISCAFKLAYIGSRGARTEIVYINGSIIKIGYIGLEVNVTNNYFLPVQIHYNGFEYVMLVCNRTVTDPSDVVNNKPFLVWGAFYALRALSNVLSFTQSWAYDYYATNRNLSNYTATISAGGIRKVCLFISDATEPIWAGQDLKWNFVTPGIYYIYCLAYGRKLEPISLNITRTGLWDDC